MLSHFQCSQRGPLNTSKRAAAAQLLLFIVLFCFQCRWASTQTFEFLPEIDAYFKATREIQVYFQAKETREGGIPPQGEIGSSVEFYLKPWLKLKDATLFDLDEAKKRPLVFTIGYRYLVSPNAPPDNRLRLDLTPHFPIKGKLLITDRNRADLDWQSGNFTWRYRNRLTVERELTIHSYHPQPYISAEVFYESKYQKWSTTALYAGSAFPIRKWIQFDIYYEHQHNTGKSPNQKLHQMGLILDLYP